MKKTYRIVTVMFSLFLGTIPALASDPPSDEGHYIWQDENNEYWYRDGTEDIYIGEGNYSPDPDSGMLMEANDAGWNPPDGYFEPHYYYEDGSVWFENGDQITYIGSRDDYYIDDYGQLCEKSGSSASTDSSDSSLSQDSSNQNFSSEGSTSSDTDSSLSSGTHNSAVPEYSGELYLTADFQADDIITGSLPDGLGGYSRMYTLRNGRSTAVQIKQPRTDAFADLTSLDFLAEYYPADQAADSEETLTVSSYPASRFHYQSSINEEPTIIDALVCHTDDYLFGLFILTANDTYEETDKSICNELFSSAQLIYAERIDMAQTDYFQVLTPELWKYLCHYEIISTGLGGYQLIYYNNEIPVLTLEARYHDNNWIPDSVWQSRLGLIHTPDGSTYDLLVTISQYSEDASDEWKKMYDTCQDVLNGIYLMDGCDLTAE